MSSLCSWCSAGVGARVFWLCGPHRQLEAAHQALAAQERERVQAAYVEGRSERVSGEVAAPPSDAWVERLAGALSERLVTVMGEVVADLGHDPADPDVRAAIKTRLERVR